MREKLGVLSGALAMIIIISFGVSLAFSSVAQNLATWTMWTVLDAILLAGAISAGNKRPWLPAGFVFGATVVTVVLLRRGEWQWHTAETLAALGVSAAILLWWRSGPKGAIVAATTGLTVAGIPTLIDAIYAPDPATWWLWAGVSVSAILTLVGAKKWTVEEVFLPIGSLFFNGAMTILVLR